jgi:hypothetical protein
MAIDVGKGSMGNSGRLLCWGLGIFGAALLGFSAITITSFVGALARRAPIIVWDEGGWIALPIALALLALTLALYIGRHHGQNVAGRRSDTIKRLLILAAGLLPFALLLPFGAHWLAGRHLEARGYRACGEAFWITPDEMPEREAALARCEAWRRG